LQSEKYKAYASKGLGDYYFDNKDLSKAKKYSLSLKLKSKLFQ